MPLSQRVSFKTMLQKQNRLQAPALVRWRFKLEASEVLRVSVSVVGLFSNTESFLARMQKDGRIAIPKLTLALMKRNEPSFEGYAMGVTLELAATHSSFGPFKQILILQKSYS